MIEIVLIFLSSQHLSMVSAFLSTIDEQLYREEVTVTYLKEHGDQCVHSDVADSKWRIDCNWCHCLPHKKAACTLKQCLTETKNSTPPLPVCSGDARWKVDNISCKCIDNQAHCTEKEVFKNKLGPPNSNKNYSISNKETTPETYTAPICEYRSKNDAWKNKCNWCRCSRSGVSLCTKKSCLKRDEPVKNKKIICRGNARWMPDPCNWCACVDGYGNCTSKSCVADDEIGENLKDEECFDRKPGSEGKWKFICNWCSCYHGVKMCTRNKCITALSEITNNGTPPVVGEKSDMSVICIEGSSWIEKCNTCYCVTERIQCTEKLCNSDDAKHVEILAEKMITTYIAQIRSMILKARISNIERCTYGSSWREECNWCRCVTGLGVCTNKICIDRYRIQLYEPACISGAEWMNDCNVCKCLDGIPFCSNLRCSRDVRIAPSDTTTKCTAGSRWMMECNWCRCAFNGNPLCSLSVCSTVNHTELCAEGSQWRKDDCNWCICSEGLPICSPVPCTITPHESTNEISAVQDDPTASDVSKHPETCKDGTRTSDGCNWCTCANGIQICTQMECVDFNQPPTAIEPSAPAHDDPDHQSDPAITDELCIEGNTWVDMCNTCICVQGVQVCSGQAC